jgi:predicted nucleotide-binding protein
MENTTLDRFSTDQQRINIFIGSSTESKDIAYAIGSHFEADKFNVTVWDKAFERNKSNLDNLKKFTATYDYAIFVFALDKGNKLEHRGVTYENLPANTIFEAGLFFGRLGESRTFFLAEDAISDFVKNVLSDLTGISLGKTFRNDPDKTAEENVKAATERIKDEILENYASTAEVRFLPSTALAIGYFENFILRVMPILLGKKQDRNGRLQLQYGQQNPKHFDFDFHDRDFKLKVVLPDVLREANHDNIRNNSYRAAMDNTYLQTATRPFGIFWKVQTQADIDRDGFVFYDFPTTLFSSHKAIDLVLHQGSGLLSKKHIETVDRVGEKEIHNFLVALDCLVMAHRESYLKDSVEITSLGDTLK